MLSSQPANPDCLASINQISAQISSVNQPISSSSPSMAPVYGYAAQLPGSPPNSAVSPNLKSSVSSQEQAIYAGSYSDPAKYAQHAAAVNPGIAYGIPYTASHAQFQPVYMSYGGIHQQQHQQQQQQHQQQQHQYQQHQQHQQQHQQQQHQQQHQQYAQTAYQPSLYPVGPAPSPQNIHIMPQSLSHQRLSQGDLQLGGPTSPLSIPHGGLPFPVPITIASSAPTNMPSSLPRYPGTQSSQGPTGGATNLGRESLGIMNRHNSTSGVAGPGSNEANMAGAGRPGFVVFNPRSKDPPLGKRTKVSRACDECRRKKTRCDFDADREVCSPCRRACVQCTFERAQLKRGPARKRHSHGALSSPELNGSSSKFSPPLNSFSLTNYNAHHNTFNYNRTRSRSTSSALSDSLLPPIESLLGRGYQDRSPRAVPSDPQQHQQQQQHQQHQQYQNQNQQQQHQLNQQQLNQLQLSPKSTVATATGNANATAAPGIANATAGIAGANTRADITASLPSSNTLGIQFTGTDSMMSGNEPLLSVPPKKSSFPLLVEVACRQSESPISDESALSPTPTTPTTPQSSRSSISTSPTSATTQATPMSASSSTAVNPEDKMEHDQSTKSSLKTSPSSTKTLTPPPQYDAGVHGISHNALMEYYTFVHPTFPLLPDLVAEFDEMFRAAGPAKEYLVAALNGNIGSAVPLGLGTVMAGPLVGKDLQQQSTIRESHLISLLFMYMHTLDTAWLGAGVAACATLLKDPLARRAEKLTALVVAFDRIHSTLFELPSFVPGYFIEPAKGCSRMQRLLKLLRWDYAEDGSRASDDSQKHFHTAPEAALRIFGQLGRFEVTRSEAKNELEKLLPQLHHTPLEVFVKQLMR